LNHIYNRSLTYFLQHKSLVFPVIAIAVILVILLWQAVPAEMAPLEDRSQITIRSTAPEGATFEFLRDYTGKVSQTADSIAPERRDNFMMVNSTRGFSRLMLPPLAERTRSQMEIANRLTQALKQETDARAFVQQQSTFGGRRSSMPIQYVIQSQNLDKLQQFLPAFMEKVNASPQFQMADVNLKFTKPETRIIIDRDKSSLLGVSALSIGQTLQYALSGQRMGYFYMNGKQYQILGEINRQQRNTPLDLKSLYVKNNAGEMIQLDNLVQLEEAVAPPQLYRYNRFSAATVTAALSPGTTIGQGLDQMDNIAQTTLDETFRTALAGESKDFRESSSSLMFAFILAIVLIFLILAAQFESFKDPFVIMLTVPLAVAGALIFMWLSGVTMNIFSQIGIIMLIGLVTKNGILIVEFANQRQTSGIGKFEAIREASRLRLRPILMTSLATVLGLVPLIFSNGEGSNSRYAMGMAVVGGMIISTFLTLYVVPAVYLFVSTEKNHNIPTDNQIN
jgi:multidrug efflux pump